MKTSGKCSMKQEKGPVNLVSARPATNYAVRVIYIPPIGDSVARCGGKGFQGVTRRGDTYITNTKKNSPEMYLQNKITL